MSNVMILGAGRGQVGLYKAASEMGHRTLAVSIPGKYPGFALADEISYTDIMDPEAVLQVAKAFQADAVVSACVDITVPAIGRVCDEMKLCGISYDAAVKSTNKLLMKKEFEKKGVRTARFVRVSPEESPVEASRHLSYPLIVKPVDLAGSKGINIVMREAELPDAFARTMQETRESYCIIEEYLDGYEFSGTAFVRNGEILFILPTGDVRHGENDEIPAGHYLPFEMEESAYRDFLCQMEGGIRALGLDNCAVNADLMYMNGLVYILEMTGRLGANCIPELTSIYTGYDIHRLIIDTALGRKDAGNHLSDSMPKRPCFAQMVLSEESGILKGMTFREMPDPEVSYLFFLGAGDEVRKFRTTSDCIGQVVASGDTLEEAKAKVQKTLADICIDLEKK